MAAAWLLQFLWGVLSQAGVFVVMLLVAWIVTVATLGPVRLLQRLRIPRPIASGLVYLVVLGIAGASLFFVLPPFFTEVGHAAESLTAQARGIPEGLSNLQTWLSGLGAPDDIVGTVTEDVSDNLASMGQELASGVIATTGTIAGGVAATIVTLIISFYLVLGWDRGVDRMSDALPPDWAARLNRGVRASEHTFGAWLGGQFLASVIWGIAVVVAYLIAGLEFGLLVAVGTGILMFIPFFGMIVGIAIPTIMAFTVRIDLAIWVGVALALVSLAIENVVKPRIMGTAIGVNPIVVLSSVILGGIAAGFWGVLFGIPIGALLWTTLRGFLREFLVMQRRRTRMAMASAASDLPVSPVQAVPETPSSASEDDASPAAVTPEASKDEAKP
ncbi:MAG: AI-2E family transporter [Chloroflexota bacterium]|nr:AI-2E family transporter [Chloroflexota bacterium]